MSKIEQEALAPTVLVVFGATGDLGQRKLLPALLDLSVKNYLPKRFRIVGFAHGTFDNEGFQEFTRAALENKRGEHGRGAIESLIKIMSYQHGDFLDPASYEKLAEHLITIDEEFGMCTNKLFYLAVPPKLYDTIFQNLADSGLTIPCSNEEGWTRILVEKPFGKDAETARMLDEKLGLLFKEPQIFRIDHYLAKETLQNILSFRFSNALFEPVWNNKFIERVEIRIHEVLGIEGRGEFYDAIGALRDVGQSHALQMLAFVAMENPGRLTSENIRNARNEVFKSLKPIVKGEIGRFVKRAQFFGYHDEENIKSNSTTETFFRLEARLTSERWRGVPFILESGKNLKEKRTEIKVYFKEQDPCLCPENLHVSHQNTLTFRIQPNEGISVLFWAKRPGFEFGLDQKELSFSYNNSPDVKALPDAYERILFDCIRGDQTLFISTDEVKCTWKFITPILEDWHDTELYRYAKGSDGSEI